MSTRKFMIGNDGDIAQAAMQIRWAFFDDIVLDLSGYLRVKSFVKVMEQIRRAPLEFAMYMV